MREPMANPGDAGLLQRIAAGDGEALAALYDGHAESLFAVALRILRDRTTAEDVVHDVFLSLHVHANRYDPERGGVRTWLLTLTRNRAIDRVRRVRRQTELHATFQFGGAAFTTPLPIAALDASTLHEALACLPDDQRRVLDALYFDGLTFAEVAARFDWPIGTVKSRAARAIASLREKFSGDEPAVDAYVTVQVRSST